MASSDEMAVAGPDGAKHELLTYLDSPEFLRVSASNQRLVNRLKTNVVNDDLYPINQDLRNIHFRFVNDSAKIEPLTELLHKGAIYLLESNELITGQDIALLQLKVASKCLEHKLKNDSNYRDTELDGNDVITHQMNKTISFTICRQVASIATRLPDTELGRIKFIAETLNILNPKILNRDLLHNVLGQAFWDRSDYVSARYHFLFCANLKNARDIGRLLVDYHESSKNRMETDLFLTHFIFQLLCNQNPIDSMKPTSSGSRSNNLVSKLTVSRRSRHTIKMIAVEIFRVYRAEHPILKSENQDQFFKNMPLLNFLNFIISILDSTPPETHTFKILTDIYRPIWSRDPNYQAYLERIGLMYFGLVNRQKHQDQNGFFNNIIMSLFDGNESDQDDDGESNKSNNMSLCELDELD